MPGFEDTTEWTWKTDALGRYGVYLRCPLSMIFHLVYIMAGLYVVIKACSHIFLLLALDSDANHTDPFDPLGRDPGFGQYSSSSSQDLTTNQTMRSMADPRPPPTPRAPRILLHLTTSLTHAWLTPARFALILTFTDHPSLCLVDVARHFTPTGGAGRHTSSE